VFCKCHAKTSQLPPSQLNLWSVRRKGPSFNCISNLMWIAWFVQKLRGSQNLKIGSRDPSHAHLGVVLWSIHREGSVIYVCTKFQTDSLIRSEVMRGPKICKLGHMTQDTPTGPYAGRLSPLSLYQICSGLLDSFER